MKMDGKAWVYPHYFLIFGTRFTCVISFKPWTSGGPATSLVTMFTHLGSDINLNNI
jgi:hypothetical protein